LFRRFRRQIVGGHRAVTELDDSQRVRFCLALKRFARQPPQHVAVGGRLEREHCPIRFEVRHYQLPDPDPTLDTPCGITRMLSCDPLRLKMYAPSKPSL